MPSNKKAIRKAARPTSPVSKPVNFSKILQSTKKAKAEPIDRSMIFVSYLVEQEIDGHAKSRNAGSRKPKPGK